MNKECMVGRKTNDDISGSSWRLPADSSRSNQPACACRFI